MPNLSGLQLLAEWRGDSESRFPVFVLTSKDLTAAEKEYLRTNTGAFFCKQERWQDALIRQLQRRPRPSRGNHEATYSRGEFGTSVCRVQESATGGGPSRPATRLREWSIPGRMDTQRTDITSYSGDRSDDARDGDGSARPSSWPRARGRSSPEVALSSAFRSSIPPGVIAGLIGQRAESLFYSRSQEVLQHPDGRHHYKQMANDRGETTGMTTYPLNLRRLRIVHPIPVEIDAIETIRAHSRNSNTPIADRPRTPEKTKSETHLPSPFRKSPRRPALLRFRCHSHKSDEEESKRAKASIVAPKNVRIAIIVTPMGSFPWTSPRLCTWCGEQTCPIQHTSTAKIP